MVAALAMVGAGAVLRPIGGEARPAPLRRAGHAPASVGSGVSLAALGGFRALVADMLWLKAYAAWLTRDPASTQTLIRLVTTIDDRPLCFWLNGARIMAYDVAAWRLESARGDAGAPAEVRRRIVEEQAQAALDYLEEGRRHHPESAALCVEMANLHLNCRADIAAAAAWYRVAAESPDAPYFAARIHAALLVRLGRSREAHAWLCRLHPTLPSGDERAMAPLVLGRIRDLERALQIPENERYVFPDGR